MQKRLRILRVPNLDIRTRTRTHVAPRVEAIAMEHLLWNAVQLNRHGFCMSVLHEMRARMLAVYGAQAVARSLSHALLLVAHTCADEGEERRKGVQVIRRTNAHHGHEPLPYLVARIHHPVLELFEEQSGEARSRHNYAGCVLDGGKAHTGRSVVHATDESSVEERWQLGGDIALAEKEQIGKQFRTL